MDNPGFYDKQNCRKTERRIHMEMEFIHTLKSVLDVAVQPIHQRLDGFDHRLDGMNLRLGGVEG